MAEETPTPETADTEARVILMCQDGAQIAVRRQVVTMLKTVEAALEDAQEDDVVPIANIKGDILQKVVDYCEFQLTEAPNKSEEERRKWEAEFLNLDHFTLFHVILAANFLNCQPLLDIGCKNVADQIRTRTPADILTHFHIRDDFTKEEYEEVKRENQWCEQQFTK